MILDETKCIAFCGHQYPRLMKTTDANHRHMMRLDGGIRIRGNLLYSSRIDDSGTETARLYRIVKVGTIKELHILRKWNRHNYIKLGNWTVNRYNHD